MYRRIFFIAIVPLLGVGSVRASLGCGISVVSLVLCRESSPFLRDSTNVLLIIGAIRYYDFHDDNDDDYDDSDLILGMTYIQLNTRFSSCLSVL
jgi:hypothetical protein